MDDTKAVGDEGVTEPAYSQASSSRLRRPRRSRGRRSGRSRAGRSRPHQCCNGRSGGLAATSVAWVTFTPESSAGSSDEGQRKCRVDLALGAAEVGQDDDLGAGIGQRLKGRQRRADAAIVGDDAVLRGGTLKSERTRTRLPLGVRRKWSWGEPFSGKKTKVVCEMPDARACTGISCPSWLSSVLSGELGTDGGGEANEGVR